MRRPSLLLLFLLWLLPLVAQNPRQEVKEHHNLSGSNLTAYPGPQQEQLTPPPDGMVPFYLSHYGRHGSRYMTKIMEYDYVHDILQKAHESEKLSPLGEDLLRRLLLLNAEQQGRLGELSPLGAQQHRDIARRMMERFPEVFQDSVVIDARSTPVVRCVLSMQNELLQLMSMNPRLRVVSDASQHDMYYMNLTDTRLTRMATDSIQVERYKAFRQKHSCWQRVLGQLFTDTAYVSEAHIDGEQMNFYLFRLTGIVQNMEVRHQFSLYDLYTDDEILANWRMNNVFWFMGFSGTALNGGLLPYLQRNLLRRIITDADSCLQLPHPGATLRFGHDTMLLPLVCLMGINGYDRPLTDLEQIDQEGWVDYRVFPMSGNLQIVFYRHPSGEGEVLLKVLLNENEATLPLPSAGGPYYRWRDFRDYYLKKLDAFVPPAEQ